jgi:hypothetical protein
MSVPAFAELKVLLAWMRQHRAELDRWYLAMALVSDSPVLRGALRAILALGPLAARQLVCADVEEAVTWAGNIVRAGTKVHV